MCTCVARADGLVSGGMHLALRVAHLGLGHARHALVRKLHTPETPGSEAGEFAPTRRGIIVRPLRNGDLRWVVGWGAAGAESQHAQKPIHGSHEAHLRASLVGNHAGSGTELQPRSDEAGSQWRSSSAGTGRHGLCANCGNGSAGSAGSGLRHGCRQTLGIEVKAQN